MAGCHVHTHCVPAGAGPARPEARRPKSFAAPGLERGRIGRSAAGAQVGAVLRGAVSSVKPYGLFVRLDGFRANALVHLSQVTCRG